MARQVEEVRKQTAIRLTDSEKKEIIARAGQHGMNLTEYMVRCSLGTLDPSTSDEKFAEINERLEQLEKLANLGAFG